MKTIFSPVKQSYLAKIGILLIVVALVAGILSCNGNGAATYDLTMAVAPVGGGTATDETGTSPYGVLEVVDIKAVADPCYRFVNWQATAGIFGNATAAETTFLMPAEDVTVTANFEPIPPDHYKFYLAEWWAAPPETFPADVQLVDQFGTFNATVGEAAYWFGNPVEKVHGNTTTPLSDPNRHYTIYHLDYEEGWEPQSWQVTFKNQFGENQELTVEGPSFLAVPTQKEDQEMSDCLDHLLVYNTVEYVPEPIGEVDLYDQFQDELGVTVYEPMLFANPVQKTVLPGGSATPIEHEDEHYVFYPIAGESFNATIQITNQFGNQTLDLQDPFFLAVPSQKISWEQPLDHFKTYWADWPLEPLVPPPQWEPPLPVDVQLEDQFVTINATVTDPYLFANPVEKWVSKFEWTPIWDPKDHLTLYDIVYKEDPLMWEVTVNNQFGNNQWLQVVGPFHLAVPTGKLALECPADLNHFLVYYVYDYEIVPNVGVLLSDQFTEQETVVYEPYLFAVPAQKIHDGVVTDIKDDEHLLFYWLGGGGFTAYNLPVVNQFGQQYLDVEQGEDLLGVPSKKTVLGGPYPAPPIE